MLHQRILLCLLQVILPQAHSYMALPKKLGGSLHHIFSRKPSISRPRKIQVKSAISEEGSTINATSEEETISDVPEPYRMTSPPNLDNMSLRRSKQSKKPSEDGAAIKSAVQNIFFNLFSMFCLLSVSALATYVPLIPSTVAQKVVLHAEKSTSNFDGT